MSADLRAYGLLVESVDIDLPARTLPARAPGALARVRVSAASAADVRAAWSGEAEPPLRGLRRVGGRQVVTSRGLAGDVLVTWEDGGTFHLDPPGVLLLAHAPAGTDAAWTRFLLDTVLTTVALRHGAEALHAGAVATQAGAIAIIGGSGGGKTSLVAELMDRGARLVADDVTVVRRDGTGFVAEPAPPVLSLDAQRPFGPPAARLGRTLAQIDSELFVLATDTAAAPIALQACVLLDRGAGDEPVVAPAAGAMTLLLTHLLHSGSGRTRQEARFALAGDIAERVAMLRLSAPAAAPPSALADALERALA